MSSLQSSYIWNSSLTSGELFVDATDILWSGGLQQFSGRRPWVRRLNLAVACGRANPGPQNVSSGPRTAPQAPPRLCSQPGLFPSECSVPFEVELTFSAEILPPRHDCNNQAPHQSFGSLKLRSLGLQCLLRSEPLVCTSTPAPFVVAASRD